jgi:hypothetical protein
VSLQANSGEDGTIKGQVYTGIVVLDDLVYDQHTGRASLPSSEERIYARVLELQESFCPLVPRMV